MNRKVIALSFVAAILGGTLGVYSYFVYTKLPSYAGTKEQYAPSDLVILDSQQQVIQSTRWDYEQRQLLWTDLEDISPALKTEVIRAEDQRFYTHPGFDLRAIVGSIWQWLHGNGLRGASTISMQLIKMLEKEKKSNVLSKSRQIFKAALLDFKWSKEQILEAYLNLVPFRGEVRGVRAAATMFFQKSPIGLTQIDSLLMATQIRAPNASKEQWLKRSCAQAPLLCSGAQQAIDDFRITSHHQLNEQNAFEYSQMLKRQGLKGVVSTDIHKDLQNFVRQQVLKHLKGLQKDAVSEAAVLVLENETGKVWAYIGNSGVLSKNPYVDGVMAYRQAGSTLKPFLYGQAFKENILRADSLIEDSPLEISLDRGVYRPRNHDLQHYGWVTSAQALGSSLNVPAVKVMQMLPERSLHGVLTNLGFQKLLSAEHYGPALALGVADISLWDLTNAYRALAQKGIYSSIDFPGSSEKLVQRQVYSSEVAFEVSRILSTNSYRSLGFGLDSVLNSTKAAVKTGTSKDMRDNWCVGFNEKFTVGVWLGNFTGESMRNVMGVSGAAPIWAATMQWLDEKYPVALEITPKQSSLEFEELYHQRVQQPLKVSYPTSGSIIALDPEIPKQLQKVPLISSRSDHDVRWKINGTIQEVAGATTLWEPQLGKNLIELISKEGAVIDSVEVLVR